MEAEVLTDLIDRYVRAWNEPDADRRRNAVTALYTDKGRVVTQSNTYQGIEATIGHIADVYDQFVDLGRFQFRSGGAVGHHDSVLFRWEMVEGQDGQLADAGMNLLQLAPDGRIDADYQFNLGVESSIGHLAVAR